MSYIEHKYIIDGIEYKKSGFFGCQLSSRENGVKKNSTRVINEQLFYAWVIKRRLFSKDEISWCMYPPPKNAEDVHTILGRVLSNG
jgi:hypothetical protein